MPDQRDQPGLNWITRLVVPAKSLDGATSRVIIGVLDTDKGPKRALVIGHDADPVVLRRQSMAELISHARAVLTEKIPEDWT
ncbi:hypothetical protein [Amycolatopsis sp. NPDC059021]|uniref:hypothetical protein n=1 Tax=Amycolatopsis sp. NPDC059021 TaxID=3346704 RepID=UPI00366BEACC